MHRTARAISILLHPLWMPAITLALCFGTDPRLTFAFAPSGRWLLLGTVFVMTGLFPLTSALMMLRNGLISSLDMPYRRERIPAYFMALIYYALCYYLMWRVPNDDLTMSVLFGSVLALLTTLLITLRWKISAHMVGAGGVIGGLLAVMLLHGAADHFVLLAAFLAAGLLGSARLLVSDHTPAQIYAGALLGCGCVLGCAWYNVFL